jgi:hypothetical protein
MLASLSPRTHFTTTPATRTLDRAIAHLRSGSLLLVLL